MIYLYLFYIRKWDKKYKRIARVAMTTSTSVNLESTVKILLVLGQVFLLLKLTAFITI